MHHHPHNQRIKIVPFNQADNDETIPNTFYLVISRLVGFRRIKRFSGDWPI